MDKLLGFAPDVDPTLPGIFTACQHIMPTAKGFQGAPGPASANVAALAAPCRGAVVATRLDDGRRIFAGTQTKLYELIGTAWTDRSAAGSYTGSVDSRWSFCQFGDTTVASNLVDAMQGSASGAFAAITGPKAKIVISVSNNFVIAFNTNEGVYGSSPDRWWCCAQNDQTNWVPSVATAANTGRLVARPGSIQAALPLGDYAIAYKTRGVFLGSYVGGAEVWRWTLVPGSEDCGAVGQDAVCDIGGSHFLVGPDDFWIFDGSSAPKSVGEAVREWFAANSSQTYAFRTKASFDRQRQVVWIAFAGRSSSGAVDKCICYHVKSGHWGVDDYVTQAPLTFIAPGVTIDGLNAYSATIDGLPAVPFDSAYWLSGGRAFSYFNSENLLVVKNGPCADSTYTTGDYGDDDIWSDLERVRVRFIEEPDTARATGMWRVNGGAALQAGPAEDIYDGGFDVRQSGRWHRVKFDFTGDHAETGHRVPLLAGGSR